MTSDRIDHLIIHHPTLRVLLLESRLRKLDGHRLEASLRQSRDQAIEPKHRVAEGVMKVSQSLFRRDPVRFVDELMPDLNAEIIPRRQSFRHPQEKASTRATNIQQQRPVRFREDGLDIDRLRRLPVKRRQWIYVLVNSNSRHVMTPRLVGARKLST